MYSTNNGNSSQIKSFDADKESTNFQKSLDEYLINLKKLEIELEDGSDSIYDECVELKRCIQLEKEETIERFKKENEIVLNTDELGLERGELIKEIDSINKKADNLIEKVEHYENESLTAYKKNKSNKSLLECELKKLKESSEWCVADDWKDFKDEQQ